MSQHRPRPTRWNGSSELVDVEATAHAAGEAVTQPSASSPRARRTSAPLYALVIRTADEASAALTLIEQLVAALSARWRLAGPWHELARGAR